ncbi:MAG: glycoside hydrolase family 16 protein [Novosphingobium sp.]|uniref:glycoside hydrolase family 16 protein n=1 Tax=Novosphingobium sp. TaxID=1874826 RepID=UPI0032BAA640
MKRTLSALALLATLALSSASRAEPGWALVWADEFDGPSIDKRKWGFDADCWGGGNDERQCYTKSGRNAAIEDGKLVITARYERTTGAALPLQLRRQSSQGDREATRDFSSARLTTRGRASWQYGRIEVRARLPQGQGTWPAIWMLPEKTRYGPWAASGEIDILEAVNLGVICTKCPGGRENTIFGTIHFGAKPPGNTQAGTEIGFLEVLDGFHTYAVEWFADRIIWQVDGRSYAERKAGEWFTAGSKTPGAPFDQPFHLILNLAIGGKLPEGRGLGGVRNDGYPKRMEVDWVRVWQKPVIGARAPAGSVKTGGN